jgi:ABC-type transporter lipoprotein component MlaA
MEKKQEEPKQAKPKYRHHKLDPLEKLNQRTCEFNHENNPDLVIKGNKVGVTL